MRSSLSTMICFVPIISPSKAFYIQRAHHAHEPLLATSCRRLCYIDLLHGLLGLRKNPFDPHAWDQRLPVGTKIDQWHSHHKLAPVRFSTKVYWRDISEPVDILHGRICTILASIVKGNVLIGLDTPPRFLRKIPTSKISLALMKTRSTVNCTRRVWRVDYLW